MIPKASRRAGFRPAIHQYAGLVLIWLAGLALAGPLLGDYFLHSTDGLLHLYRALDFRQVIAAGMFWPRLAPTLFYGYGYPVFDFYSPAVYYLATGLHLVGLNAAGAMKAIAWLCLILPGLTAYWYARTYLAPVPAGLAGVLYLAAPYHLFDLYDRGDYPQALAYALVPLVFWSLGRLIAQPTGRSALALAGSGAALLLTHNLTAFLISPFLVVYVLLKGLALQAPHPLSAEAAMPAGTEIAQSSGGASASPIGRVPRFGRILAGLMGATALAALLTAVHWLPVLLDRESVRFDRLTHYQYADHFTMLSRLVRLDPAPQYGQTFGGPDGGFWLTPLQAAGLLAGIVAFVLVRRRCRGLRWEIAAQAIVAALALFLMTDLSAGIWQRVPALDFAQFPWRFLAFAGLPVAFLAAAGLQQLRQSLWAPVALAVGGLFVLSTGQIAPPQLVLSAADLEPAGIVHLELGYGPDGGVATGEFLPRQLDRPPMVSPWALSQVAGWSALNRLPTEEPPLVRTSTEPSRRVYSLAGWPGGPVTLDTAYFPGWTAQVDGRPVAIEPAPGTGLIRLTVPPGDHQVELAFSGTRGQRWPGWLSAGTAGLLLVYAAVVWWRTGARRPGGSRLIWLGRLALAAAVVAPLLLVGYRTTLVEADAWRPVDIEFGDHQLTGYRPATRSVTPGASLPIEVTWRTSRAQPGVNLYARLVNRSPHGWATAQAPAGAVAGSEEPEVGSRDSRGEEQRTTLTLAVPDDLAPGSYQIELGFRDESGVMPPTTRRIVDRLPALGLRFGPLTVQATDLGTPDQPGVNLDNRLTLTGSRIGARRGDWEWPVYGPPSTVPHETPRAPAGWLIHGDWHWQSRRSDLPDYLVSFRLVDETGYAWASHDSPPLAGLYPTSYWRAGERIYDQQDLVVGPDVPPGRYELELQVVDAGRPLTTRDASGAPAGPALRLGAVAIDPPVIWPNPADFTTDRIDRTVAAGLSVLTARLSQFDLRPGDGFTIETRWHATQALARDVSVRWELVDDAGQVWGTAEASPTGRPDFPTSRWPAGTVVRGRHQLIVDPLAPAGELHLNVSAVDALTGETLGRAPIAPLTVLEQDRAYTAQFDHPIGAVLGEAIELAGFDLPNREAARPPGTEPASSGAVEGDAAAGDRETGTEGAPGPAGQPGLPEPDSRSPTPDARSPDPPAAPVIARLRRGEPLTLHLVWRSRQTIARGYTVFVQLLDPEGRLVAQNDAPPQNGARPTSSFVPGEFVADEHTLATSATLPPGRYRLIAGLYDPLTGERLAAPDGQTFLHLAAIEVTDPSG